MRPGILLALRLGAIPSRRFGQGPEYPPAKVTWFEDLDLRPPLEDLLLELGRLRVGQLQEVGAVLLHARLLLGMPLLRRHPARGARGEAQLRPLDLLAGEDAVAPGDVLVELGRGHLLRARLRQRRLADRVDR